MSIVDTFELNMRTGNMANFIKECKDDFGFSHVGSWTREVNENSFQKEPMEIMGNACKHGTT